MKKYPIWSFLSISGIDAPLVSIAWYLYFTKYSLEVSLNIEYCIILGVSVWICYIADRLFDVRFKKKEQLISLRHQFCKEHEVKLWILCIATLIPLVILSFNTLNSENIFVGLCLVFLVILYNLLNQYFISKKFPKEICVAILFAFGTLFLVDDDFKLSHLAPFILICFLNCVILTHKDSKIDEKMCVSSWTHTFSYQTVTFISTIICLITAILIKSILNPYFFTSLTCLLLHIKSKKFDEEQFRVTLESAYTLIPILALACL